MILAFGAYLERHTALRHEPMTDLGVFACAAWAVRHGDNLYEITDWHGWHYHYPPFLAIVFAPLAHPLPLSLPPLAPGESRTVANTPWGYPIEGSQFFGLHRENARFFGIVGVWYCMSVLFIGFSVQALACTLEGRRLREPPPVDADERRRWWALRTLPLLVCAGSLGTDLSRGQVDVAMLAAVATALYLAKRRREVASGLCLAVPAAMKLFPPFLLLYPFWRRRWRMAAGVIMGVALTLAVIPGVVLGPTRAVGLYHIWLEVFAKSALGQGSNRSRAQELTNITATDNQSLLAFIHNWQHFDLPRGDRPPHAAPAARVAVYVVGALALAGIGFVAGRRRRDAPHELLLLAGLLIGLAFVVSPIVHNYYYLLLLPLVSALLDRYWAESLERGGFREIPWVLLLFLAVDLLARLPWIGTRLKDVGGPLLSLMALMAVGVRVLLRDRLAPRRPGVLDAERLSQRSG